MEFMPSIKRISPLLAAFVIAVLWFGLFWYIGPDSFGYKMRAQNIGEAQILSGEFPLVQNSIRPFVHAGYSATIALLHTILPGDNWDFVDVLVSFIGAILTALVIFRWVCTIYNFSVCWLSYALVLTNIHIIEYSTRRWGDSLSIALFSAAIYVVWKALCTKSYMYTVLAGILIGWYSQVRPEGYVAVAFLAVPFIILIFRSIRLQKGVIRSIILVTLFAFTPFIIALPKLAHLYGVNGQIGLVFDVRFLGTGITGIQYLVESYYRTFADLPPGTITGNALVGIATVEGLLPKTMYIAHGFIKHVFLFQKYMTPVLLGVPVIALMFLSIASDRNEYETRSNNTLVWYLFYICGFVFIMALILTIRDWDFGDPEYGARYFKHIIPPSIILASIGAHRFSIILTNEISNWRVRWLQPSQRTVFVTIAIISVASYLPAVYWYVKNMTPVSKDPVVLVSRSAAATIRNDSETYPVVIASDDVMVPYEAECWYLPYGGVLPDSILAHMDRYGADYLSLQGNGERPRLSGYEHLYNQISVNDGLDFIGRFGDREGYNIALYKRRRN